MEPPIAPCCLAYFCSPTRRLIFCGRSQATLATVRLMYFRASPDHIEAIFRMPRKDPPPPIEPTDPGQLRHKANLGETVEGTAGIMPMVPISGILIAKLLRELKPPKP